MTQAEVTGPRAPESLGRAAARAREGISRLISDGVFVPGGKLPGERDLAEMVGVSRSVLRDALAALQAEGVLESSPWRGWFVRGRQVSERVELQSFTERARERGLTATARVLHSAVRPSSAEEAVSLAIAPAAPVLETHRLRSLDGVPACIDISVIPLSRAPGLAEESLEDASLYDTLESVCGVRIVRSDYTVRAAAASPATGERLGVEPGTPVLVGEEVAFDAAGVPVILGQATFRNESYQFRATLFRPAVPGAGA